MPLSWKHCILGTWPIFCIFIICFIRKAFSVEPCQPPDRLYADVPENAAKGSRVLKINYKNGQIWKISGETPVGYFALEKGNTSFYLITKQIPDYEKLKEKGDNMAVDLECTSDQEIIPFHIAIFLKAVNEFTPTFTQRVYNRTISEDARKGDTVFIVSDVAKDQDYGDTLVFNALEIPRDKNGIVSPKFNMTDHVTGTIVLNGRLDYEKQKKYLIQIVASDRDGKNATAKLIVNVADVDDLGPVFIPNPCPSDDPLCQIPTFYHAQIMAADKGPITIYPNPVKAINTESDDYPISYSFSKGVPSNIENYFQINSRDATIQKLAELPENVTSSVKLFIKAEENSPLKHSSVSILVVHILDRNSTEIWSPTLKTKPSSVGESTFIIFGLLVSIFLLLVLLALILWLRQRRRPTRQAIPASNPYFARPDFATKVFPSRDKRTSCSDPSSCTVLTTILREDSDDSTSDRPISGHLTERNFPVNGSIKGRLTQVVDPSERAKPQLSLQNSKSLRSLAWPIYREWGQKTGSVSEEGKVTAKKVRVSDGKHLQEERKDFQRSSDLGSSREWGQKTGPRSEEYKVTAKKAKAPGEKHLQKEFKNFQRITDLGSSRERTNETLTNGTLETYVSDYPTQNDESRSGSRGDPKRADSMEINAARRLTGSPLNVTRGNRDSFDRQQNQNQSHRPKIEKVHPRMPTETAPSIPSRRVKTETVPVKPPRRFPHKQKNQISAPFLEGENRLHRIQKHPMDKSGDVGSILDHGKETLIFNQSSKHAVKLSPKYRCRSGSAGELAMKSLPVPNHSRSSSKPKRLKDAQNRERLCRSLEKKLQSLEETRMRNRKLNRSTKAPPIGSSIKDTPPAPRATRPLPDLEKEFSIGDGCFSSRDISSRSYKFSSRGSTPNKYRTAPPLPARKSNTDTRSHGEAPNADEDDPLYVNVKYTTLISDNRIGMTNSKEERLNSFEKSNSLDRGSRVRKQYEERVYLEPSIVEPCLEADLNIRAKLELILASALQNKESKEKIQKETKKQKLKQEVHCSDETILTITKPSLHSYSPSSSSSSSTASSSSSSSSSEQKDSRTVGVLKSRSLENIFLSSANVVWPDPETALAALHQHLLAMEDYTKVSVNKNPKETTSPCASITSLSSNSSRCHFGWVNPLGQFIVDIPCAESNVRKAKMAKAMAMPFREVETSMGFGINSQNATGCQPDAYRQSHDATDCQADACRHSHDATGRQSDAYNNSQNATARQSVVYEESNDDRKGNKFPVTVSFEGIDQYETLHGNFNRTPNRVAKLESATCRENRTDRRRNPEKENSRDNQNQNLGLKKVDSKEQPSLRFGTSSLSVPCSETTTDSRLDDTSTSIPSDCATVMSSELYEPTDSDGETVRSLRIFDSIFDGEESAPFSSAESDSQSVFFACHPRSSLVCDRPDAEEREVKIAPDNSNTKNIDNVKNKNSEDERQEGDDDVIKESTNRRSGRYYVNVDRPIRIENDFRSDARVQRLQKSLDERTSHKLKKSQKRTKRL